MSFTHYSSVCNRLRPIHCPYCKIKLLITAERYMLYRNRQYFSFGIKKLWVSLGKILFWVAIVQFLQIVMFI